jgi:hypothetical protein
MLDTFIKNRGVTKTIVHDNHKNHVNEIKWDADYDGNIANISLDVNDNGHQEHYNVSLNHEDLMNVLNVPSVPVPLDKRLKRDFKKLHSYDPMLYQPILPESTLQEELTHLSSPLSKEQFIIPLTIDEKPIHSYTVRPRKHDKRKKTKKTRKMHKVYTRSHSSTPKSTSTTTYRRKPTHRHFSKSSSKKSLFHRI